MPRLVGGRFRSERPGDEGGIGFTEGLERHPYGTGPGTDLLADRRRVLVLGAGDLVRPVQFDQENLS